MVWKMPNAGGQAPTQMDAPASAKALAMAKPYPASSATPATSARFPHRSIVSMEPMPPLGGCLRQALKIVGSWGAQLIWGSAHATSKARARHPLRKPGKQEADKRDYQQDKEMGLEQEELTGSVIGAALEVHKALGPGFLESVYENALTIELQARGIGCGRQLTVPILFRGSEVGLHRCWWLG